MSIEPELPTRAFAARRPPPAEEPPRRSWRAYLTVNAFGLMLLIVALGWSCLRVAMLHHRVSGGGGVVIRIAHWQLEAGYREAMQSVIDDYNRLHAAEGIQVEQVPVTEKVYAQWLNVNLIADNAPDLAELGSARLASATDAVAKYFTPLGREVTAPNPYNAQRYLDELDPADAALADRLEHAPWRETLVDGMRGGYRQDLQDYYSVPTAFFTQRMFYNRALFREALGSDAPPRTLGELFASAQRLREWAAAHGRTLDPIAGTRYHRDLFVWTYRVTFTSGYQYAIDDDYSGDISDIEAFAGFQSGRVSMNDQRMRDYYEVIRRICGLFNRNFSAMDRDQAIAAFASGSAAMMASGSWDGNSVFAACPFEVGVTPFPLPAPGEPYSASGTLPVSEAAAAGAGGFGIARSSKHPEIALDFLRFLTSQKWNQKLNRGSGWLPVTMGTHPAPRMEPFMPNPYGVIGDVGFHGGGDVETIINGKNDLYLAGEIPYEELARSAQAAMSDPHIGYPKIWRKKIDDERDQLRSLERTIAVQSSRLLLGGADADTARKLRETVLDQSLGNNCADVKHRYQVVTGSAYTEEP